MDESVSNFWVTVVGVVSVAPLFAIAIYLVWAFRRRSAQSETPPDESDEK